MRLWLVVQVPNNHFYIFEDEADSPTGEKALTSFLSNFFGEKIGNPQRFRSNFQIEPLGFRNHVAELTVKTETRVEISGDARAYRTVM